MSLLDDTQRLLKVNKILPSKSKGQNFLISENILEKIIDSSDLKQGDNILEVGPGIGTLTRELVKKDINLKVVELDKNLVKFLKPLSESKNFEIIELDILKINPEEVFLKEFLENYKIISNLPYNITSMFLRIFLGQKYKPKEMILMLQKEVVNRIINKDGKWSKLSIMCNLYSHTEYLFDVKRDSFYPSPDVDSAVIKFSIYKKSPFANFDEKKFWQFVKIGFSSKRRTLINNLSIGLNINKDVLKTTFFKLGFDENVRAEKLSINDWINLSLT
ncbi:MAG: 16S rRNA (adenine(1518)-N(6)/adenine(1519)-N(6))-dimethyltransferase RsmA [Patescibacteria group bacterium]|nr:16S rRNA (adenine(1518)-N(6)/adenine(1519)-N(6))-dimethyltransferase RsmA [Patescibacteria group bacterium]MDD4303981.1 16S rRNA (adenine(1518)-N(6)/adenine(1519)-N(6))-dimethyltransferase RsmA [Patescibacteria group bacterium]MDD4695030.1 16S rRNA (adenine(1518)-N(6)/adenine(1519)-N(6))-dimethyltransferase RsmA [Patescibacteria group bacterium]